MVPRSEAHSSEHLAAAKELSTQLELPGHRGTTQFSQFSCSAMSDSATPWTAPRQASLSFTDSRSLLKLTSIESVMPSNHLVLSSPSPPAFNLSQHQGLF